MTIAGEMLTEENRKSLITDNFPNRYKFDETRIKIGTVVNAEK